MTCLNSPRISSHDPLIMSTTHDAFLQGVSLQIADFLKLIPFLKEYGQNRTNYTRHFYEYVTSHAELAEIFLDSCGARENRSWFFLRELVAAIRCFAKVSYITCHLEFYTAQAHEPDEETAEFQVISAQVRQLFDDMLHKAFLQLEHEARTLKIAIPLNGLNSSMFPPFDIPGRLYADMWVEESCKEDEAIVKIATSYLELVGSYTTLGFSRIFSQEELLAIVPEYVNEERLRNFEAGVHNLQSVYDTFIHHTRLEAKDTRLVKLREYVAIALNLLEIATVLVHFHERHERHARHPEIYQHLQKITGTSQILDALGNYALFYCTRFLEKGKQLSEETVMDYAQIQSRRISIPMYRGFHVRPSTYIAKIARHYGAEIQMHLGDEVYDATCVFDLFRANEKINMEKRQLIAQKLTNAHHLQPTRPDDLLPVLRQELTYLETEQAIVMHQAIQPEDMVVSDLRQRDLFTVEEVRGCLSELLTRLLALGKIDIIMPLAVTFIGDKRALHDIEILAQAGYGEDDKGSNIPLPPELAYLYH